MRKRKWFPHFQVFSVKCHLGSQFHFDKKIKAMEIKNKKQSVTQSFVFIQSSKTCGLLYVTNGMLLELN